MLAKLTNLLVAWGPWGILLLASIDSAGIPLAVGVDALVILLAAKDPAKAVLGVCCATVGSLAGSLALFYAARKGGERFLKKEAPAEQQGHFRKWFGRYGLVTVFIPALVPIPMPMKFFVACAGVLGARPIVFTVVVLLARILRYGGEAYLGVQLGEHSTRYLAGHVRELAAFAAILFLALYLLIRLSDRWGTKSSTP